MEWKETDRIKAAISNPQNVPMSLAEIVTEEISCWRASAQYQEIRMADAYYKNRSDVQKKKRELSNRSNTKMEHPIFKKLCDQKEAYLLSRAWSVDCKDKRYAGALNQVFDATFRQKLKLLLKNSVKSGIAWMQPYVNADGKLAFMLLPSDEVIPIWQDTAHEVLDAFIRTYDTVIYVGRQRKIISHAELWTADGVKWFVSESGCPYTVDTEHGSADTDYTLPHITVGKNGYNFKQVPIVWLKYNEEELSLLHYIKDIVDDYNWQTSVTADTLRDIAKFIYILRGYGGTDLRNFVSELSDSLAISVDSDGGVEKLQADLNIDAVMKHLDNNRRDLYDYACAVDTKDPNLGTASGEAIKFRYMDLDSDCMDLSDGLKVTFQQLKPFLDAYFSLTGQGDFSDKTFDIIFNTDLPVNETEVINNCKQSFGVVSNHTILKNHPWVVDVEEEIKQLEKEQEDSEDYGFGGSVLDGQQKLLEAAQGAGKSTD